MSYVKWFLFLSRITFISNVFFVIDLLLAFTHIQLPQIVAGFTLILGWAPVSPLLNFATVFALILLLVKGVRNPAPIWLIAVNMFLLVFQILYFLVY